jgi:hypothetical protein
MGKSEQELRKHHDAADTKQSGHDHSAANLYADADLSKRHGGEADYLRTAPREMRQEMGLPANATSEQLYHKMAQDFVSMFPKCSPELQREALSNLNIKRDQVGNESILYNAFIARDRRDTGTPDSASLSELERNVHKRTYQQIKNGTLPIDYD